MSQSDDAGASVNTGAPSGLPGQDRSLLTGQTPMDDDRGEKLADALGGADTPPEHPASGDHAVSAGEVLSNHDPTGGTGTAPG